LALACDQGRVIVTHDTDFLRLASQSADHWGVAFCKKNSRSLGEIIRSLVLIYEVLSPDEMRGWIEYL
jgi:predicted nuclease of predicted toxin-antitoxin system